MSITEPGTFTEASTNEDWVKAMEEELDQIEKNETWELVPRPNNKNALEEISTQNGPFNFNSNSMSSCVSQ